MTLEHKILTLIDRGVRDEADILAILDLHPCVSGALTLAICGDLIEDVRGCMSMRPKGLERLNLLDIEGES
jgi:hypothetical protein